MIACALVVGLSDQRALRGETAAGSGATAKLAERLIEQAGIGRGICLVLGRDGDVALDLARGSQMLVHVREPRASAVAELRKAADEAGLGIGRVVVEQGRLDKLPHADNMVDVVIATNGAAEKSRKLSVKEIVRVLRPEGIAILGHKAGGYTTEAGQVKALGSRGVVSNVKVWQASGRSFVQFTKPPLKGAGEWSHWEHGPDNNPMSEDAVIKAPYMTQFLAEPYYIAMPSITTAAGGRTFLAIGHIAHHRREWDMMSKLIARNGYNGTVLWERTLPEGYLVHRSAFIATAETFYMIDGDRCLLLDPQTGRETGEVRIPGLTGEWKWMVKTDGVLYVLGGRKGSGAKTIKGDRTFGGWSWADLSEGYYRQPRVPWGFGNTLAAYDLKTKQVLWKHTEKKPIDSRAMSMGEGKISFYCPERHAGCLDAKTGKVLWTNNEQKVLDLIEEPGRGLTSTPGFRSACLSVFTPEAIILQGQTRMNVIALSTADGYLLWTKKKVTNNPNALFVDGKVILGVGPGGSHVAIEPATGNVLEDLKFRKVSCTRLTGCSDSFFVRGEGTLRFDRSSKKLLIDGAVRPACNDGALPANGLLYLGPWQCDCNLSLIGSMAKCSAGDFRFDHVATEAERLERFENPDRAADFAITDLDWPTYRADNRRSAGTTTNAAQSVPRHWEYSPKQPYLPSAPTSAGGLVFVSGDDGKVRALDSKTGQLRWEFSTAGEIKMPPTIADGRAYLGSGDGYVYALEAATGRALWRFRAAPVERHIMVYGRLSSTWPVHSGVLVQGGIAYFAAGIIDCDGTYVYALDAKTGKIKWQNNSCGHLNEELRKGISAQGNLTIHGSNLLLAGGNQVSPAPFDLETGNCSPAPFNQGQPKANHGRFVGVFRDRYTIAGGRILYSSPRNVSSKGGFVVLTDRRALMLNVGGIPPAWDEQTLALVNFKRGQLTCCDADKVAARIEKGYPKPPAGARRFRANLAMALAADGAVRWQSDMGEPNKFEAVSLAVCPNAVVAVVQQQQKYRAWPQWYVVAYDKKTGSPYWRHEIRQEPLPGGLLVDSGGQVVVTMLDGKVLCLGPKG